MPAPPLACPEGGRAAAAERAAVVALLPRPAAEPLARVVRAVIFPAGLLAVAGRVLEAGGIWAGGSPAAAGAAASPEVGGGAGGMVVEGGSTGPVAGAVGPAAAAGSSPGVEGGGVALEVLE
jgi:hypothetical protein